MRQTLADTCSRFTDLDIVVPCIQSQLMRAAQHGDKLFVLILADKSEAYRSTVLNNQEEFTSRFTELEITVSFNGTSTVTLSWMEG